MAHIGKEFALCEISFFGVLFCFFRYCLKLPGDLQRSLQLLLNNFQSAQVGESKHHSVIQVHGIKWEGIDQTVNSSAVPGYQGDFFLKDLFLRSK